MSWTVACFCGALFRTPGDACPHCGSRLPVPPREAHRIGRGPGHDDPSAPRERLRERDGRGAVGT